MVMRLWLMRHGQAEGPVLAGDADRRLTPSGLLEAQRRAHDFADEWQQAVLISSPYRRAMETAAEVAEVIGGAILETWPELAPEGDPQVVLKHLQSCGHSKLVLVTHMPLLSRLTGLLKDGQASSLYPLATAGVHELEAVEGGLGAGMVQWRRTCS